MTIEALNYAIEEDVGFEYWNKSNL
jgi:hypothetical protein